MGSDAANGLCDHLHAIWHSYDSDGQITGDRQQDHHWDEPNASKESLRRMTFEALMSTGFVRSVPGHFYHQPYLHGVF